MNNWISIKDRLPKKYVTVRFYPTFGDDNDMISMDRGSIQDGGWRCENYQSLYSPKVTHWQPLPEQPEVKESKILQS